MSAAVSMPTSTISKPCFGAVARISFMFVMSLSSPGLNGIPRRFAFGSSWRTNASDALKSGYSVAPVCVSEPLSQLGTILATTGSTTDMNTIGIDLSVTTRIDDCAIGVVTATIIAGFLPCALVSSWGISVRSKLMCWSSNATSLPSTKPWRTTSALKPFTAARSAGCSPKLAMAISFGCASAGIEASRTIEARAARSSMERSPE